MPVATRDIKRRIRSIGNTRKITKAMELVAAAKMRKAVQAVLATRAYAHAAWEIVTDLAHRSQEELHPLLQKSKKTRSLAIILITSNRGLCGGFNREIIEETGTYIHEQKNGGVQTVDVILLGKKGTDIVSRHGQRVTAAYPKEDVARGVSDIASISRFVVNDFLSKKYDRVVVSYTDYVSAVSQEPYIRTILPIERESQKLGVIGKTANVPTHAFGEYLFEPSADIVLDNMLFRLIELQLYQALLESNASEHSARMFAMRNASDAASDMIDDLTLTYNQARQWSITAELADIIGGRAAVE